MANTPQDHRRPGPGLDEAPLMTLIAAAIFGYFGFIAPFMVVEEPLSQRVTILIFNWMARVVCVGLGAVFLLGMLRSSFAAPLNWGLTVLAAAGCLIAGATWLFNGYTAEGFLIVLFGALNASAARGAWRAWRQGTARTE
jgi:hypothetical protein